MARPLSENKRNAILAAAVEVVATLGVGAPTAKIAKIAGVAEGTLFTYFESKDALLNQLYLQLKGEMGEAMMKAYPSRDSIQLRARHVWSKYVDWGVANPAKRRSMSQLSVSDRVTEQTKTAGMQAFAEVNAMIAESIASGALRDHPPAFVGAMMGTLADTTMDFIAREPELADRYKNAGFDAFWGAISKPG